VIGALQERQRDLDLRERIVGIAPETGPQNESAQSQSLADAMPRH
jgi:hypothetical protein